MKGIFEKGYVGNWSHEVFTIVKIIESNPVTYKLRDGLGEILEGSFYNEDLQKTNLDNLFLVEKVLRKKKDKRLVKWIGLSDKFNSWIDEDDVKIKFV